MAIVGIDVGSVATKVVIMEGEKNPVKTLFGNVPDKFAVLSFMKIHRESIFIGRYGDGPVGYASVGSM